MKFKNFFEKPSIEELNEINFEFLKTDKEAIDKIGFEEQDNVNLEKSKKKPRKKTEEKDKKHFHGHRGRLKEKILELESIEKLKDYEILEIFLTYSIPRIDVKPIAKELLNKFKSLRNLLLSQSSGLKGTKGVGDSTIVFFKICHEIFSRVVKEEIIEEINLNSPEKVINYCKLRMSGLQFEEFRVLFLNRKNKLIQDEAIQTGTIDKAAVFPRELIKRAIELGAGAMILVHNHPSGDCTPSKADIEVTINIKDAAKLVEIYLYDHIIIGKNDHFSMRSNKSF